MPKAIKLNMNDPVYRNTHTLRLWLWNYEPNYKPLILHLEMMINMPINQLGKFIKDHFEIKDQIDFNYVDFEAIRIEFEQHMAEV
jgi:hypothetical protein